MTKKLVVAGIVALAIGSGIWAWLRYTQDEEALDQTWGDLPETGISFNPSGENVVTENAPVEEKPDDPKGGGW